MLTFFDLLVENTSTETISKIAFGKKLSFL
jgi:hypothetical protein